VEGDSYGSGDDNPIGLGLTFESVHDVSGRGSPTLIATWLPQPLHRGAPGLLHGGLAATSLDECMGALSHALDRRSTVTATMELRYRRPVPIDGRPLRVEAWRDRPELRRRNRVHGLLVLPDGDVAVEANGIFVDVGPAVARP
jgi:hypothetical protein